MADEVVIQWINIDTIAPEGPKVSWPKSKIKGELEVGNVVRAVLQNGIEHPALLLSTGRLATTGAPPATSAGHAAESSTRRKGSFTKCLTHYFKSPRPAPPIAMLALHFCTIWHFRYNPLLFDLHFYFEFVHPLW